MSNYINNKEFYKLLVEYKERCNEAKANEQPLPKIPEAIGHSFLLIAKRLSNKGNFVGYTYKEEMVSDALENCVVAIHSFNPEKSQNPFAYFTQIIWFAFLRRIEKEKKQTYVKYKALEHYMIESSIDEEIDPYSNFDISNDKMNPIIEKYEKKTKKKAKKKGVEKFIKDEDESSSGNN